MGDVVALAVVLVFLYGCEMNVNYQVDGQSHTLVLNPSEKPKP